MIAVDSVCHSENLIEATFGFLLRLLMNANCRGRGNVASSLRDSFVMNALIRGRFAALLRDENPAAPIFRKFPGIAQKREPVIPHRFDGTELLGAIKLTIVGNKKTL
jgi:hypothetical protein